MKHLTMAEKSLLIGDEAGELLMQYAALLGSNASADSFHLNAYGPDGSPIQVTLLLNSGSVLMVESSEAKFTEPDNREGIQYMHERMAEIESPRLARIVDDEFACEPQWVD